MSAAEAVRALVGDGDVVCLAGFSHLIPYALGHEVIRQGRRGLTLVKHTPDLLGEQLLAAGCLQKIVFSWHGNPSLGNLALFRRAVEGGTPERKVPWREVQPDFPRGLRCPAGPACGPTGSVL